MTLNDLDLFFLFAIEMEFHFLFGAAIAATLFCGKSEALVEFVSFAGFDDC